MPIFAPMFHAEMFNPDEWADLLSKSGAKVSAFISMRRSYHNRKSNLFLMTSARKRKTN